MVKSVTEVTQRLDVDVDLLKASMYKTNSLIGRFHFRNSGS